MSGSRNNAPECMVKTMYFWAHTHQERPERSYVNPEEAVMVVTLARWIVSQLQNPQGLTILAAYGGQVTIIQKELERYPDLRAVEVHTIDRFQVRNILPSLDIVRYHTVITERRTLNLKSECFDEYREQKMEL